MGKQRTRSRTGGMGTGAAKAPCTETVRGEDERAQDVPCPEESCDLSRVGEPAVLSEDEGWDQQDESEGRGAVAQAGAEDVPNDCLGPEGWRNEYSCGPADRGAEEPMGSYGGPRQDVDHALRSGKSGPCRKSRATDHTKPLCRCSNYEVGRRGEELASRYLEAHDYQLSQRNFRCPFGEADIVARQDDETVLIEVKTRYVHGECEGAIPELAVDAAKQKRYRRIALYYLALHPELTSVRFDVIALNLHDNQRAQLRHLVGAFEWDDTGTGSL